MLCVYQGCTRDGTHDASRSPPPRGKGHWPLVLCQYHYDEYERNREGWLIGKDAEFERLWLRRKGKEYIIGKSRRGKAEAEKNDER